MSVISEIEKQVIALENKGYKKMKVFLGKDKLSELRDELDEVNKYPLEKYQAKIGAMGEVGGVMVYEYSFSPDLVLVIPDIKWKLPLTELKCTK